MTLAELDSFLIRFNHCADQQSSSLGDVVLDIAVPTDTQQVQAKAVEQCFCPEGYQGLSCEVYNLNIRINGLKLLMFQTAMRPGI